MAKSTKSRGSKRRDIGSSGFIMPESAPQISDEERAAQREAAEAEFIAEFATSLGGRIAAQAKREGWTGAERFYATAHIKSLVFGDGSRPEGITTRIAQAVQRQFISTCIDLRVRIGSTLPGARQDWFEEALANARKRVNTKTGGRPANSQQRPAKVQPEPVTATSQPSPTPLTVAHLHPRRDAAA